MIEGQIGDKLGDTQGDKEQAPVSKEADKAVTPPVDDPPTPAKESAPSKEFGGFKDAAALNSAYQELRKTTTQLYQERAAGTPSQGETAGTLVRNETVDAAKALADLEALASIGEGAPNDAFSSLSDDNMSKSQLEATVAKVLGKGLKPLLNVISAGQRREALGEIVRVLPESDSFIEELAHADRNKVTPLVLAQMLRKAVDYGRTAAAAGGNVAQAERDAASVPVPGGTSRETNKTPAPPVDEGKAEAESIVDLARRKRVRLR